MSHQMHLIGEERDNLKIAQHITEYLAALK